MNRTKNASRNIVWGIINQIIVLVLPFVTRTVMLYSLGINYVGLGGLFSSVLQVLSFAELGIGNTLVYFMYKPIAENDRGKVSSLLNFYKRTYRIIGIIVLTIGLSILPFLNYLIASDTPDDINIYILYIVYLLNSVVGYFLYAYKQSLFLASQRTDYISKIGTFLNAIGSITQILMLLLTKNYYLYVIVIPTITILNNIITAVIADKYYPQYSCCGEITKDELNDIKKKVGGMFSQKIGWIILTSSDTIIISAFLGLNKLGVFQNYIYIVNALFGFLTVITQSIIPGIGNSIAFESVEKNYHDFRKFNFMYNWLMILCTSCLITMYQPFMEIWVGKANMLPDSIMIWFVIYFFFYKWTEVIHIYLNAKGIWWETRFIPLIASLVNLVSNLILVQFIGIVGILLSTIISVIFVFVPFNTKALFNNYFKSSLKEFIVDEIKYLSVALFTVVFVLASCSIIPLKGVELLLTKGAMSVVLASIILILIYHNNTFYSDMKLFVRKILYKS